MPRTSLQRGEVARSAGEGRNALIIQLCMTQTTRQNISAFEDSLWAAADNLRANSKLSSSEYCMPVLGVIFLRHATNRYNTALSQIREEQTSGTMPKRALVKGDFLKRRALLLPENARYDTLLNLPKDQSLSTALVEAMNAIEQDFPALLNQLPKDYEKFESDVLERLLRVFASEALRTATGDIFGRIYEYFLMKFAMQGAQDNGEFFTPPSLVQTIVNIIEPDHGVILDPACGSGGMFVQSSHFIEAHGADTSHKVTFFGQEKTATTIRLAKMNLAVHGLEGDIREANTFYEDVHELYGKCDFVMANPPFNVDMVDAEKIKDDRRLPFGLPGVNKDKKVSNGNYLWVSYFYSYLKAGGRAGFVMSSQASSAGHAEADLRRRLVETGDVDVMVAIRSNFFYTRSVPCELWHFDKGKPAARRDQVLMLDARNTYRKVTRKIYDFSPEQMQNLSAVVWLYRGQTERFIELVQRYLERTLGEAATIAGHAERFQIAYAALAAATAPFLDGLPPPPVVPELDAEGKPKPPSAPILRQERDTAAQICFAELKRWTAQIAKDWRKVGPAKLAAQHKLLTELEALGPACRSLIKAIDLTGKLANRVIDSAEKEHQARSHAAWDGKAIAKLRKALDAQRMGWDEKQGELTLRHPGLIDALKQIIYFERQAHWLLSRFPQARFADVPGLCRIVSQVDIAAADWSLTPGRYVGVAPAEIDEDFDFEQTMRDIHVELADLNAEAAGLAARIQENFEGLGI